MFFVIKPLLAEGQLFQYRRIFVYHYCRLQKFNSEYFKGHSTINFLWKFEPDVLDTLSRFCHATTLQFLVADSSFLKYCM